MRYVVCISESTRSQNIRFKSYIEKTGLGWWHYFENVWLITDNQEKTNCKELRNNVKNIFEGENVFVIQMAGDSQNDTWAGFGKTTMFEWIHKCWK